ncbi:MAG: class I SAM-dependent methyltransferase [Spirochaetes bacterium]|nr:class I SAM-dependent methyltransferase [Spirochaetota bacterium]
MFQTAHYIALSIIGLGICAAVSFRWPQKRGAPYWPSSKQKVRRMLAMAEIKRGEVVYDLGCGDGRIIVAAARRFGARAVGVEIEPFRFLWCQLLITVLGLRKKVRVIRQDLFAVELDDADVVVCYLLQRTNDRLEEKLVRELKPGTRIVSNTFHFPTLAYTRMDVESDICAYTVR